MSKLHPTPVAMLLCSVALLGGRPAPALTIDSFSMGPARLQVGDPLPPPLPQWPTEVGLAVTNVLGGGRKVTLTNATGVVGTRRAIVTVVNGGIPGFEVSNDTGVNSTVTVIWDGTQDLDHPSQVSINGLGGANLALNGNNTFILSIPSIDQNVKLALTVWAQGVSATAEHTFRAPEPRYELPFASFAGIDFSTIGAIRMVLTGPTEWDGSVTLVGTGYAPLPPTWALTGLGLAVILTVRARRRADTLTRRQD